jgi:hypothetical protein
LWSFVILPQLGGSVLLLPFCGAVTLFWTQDSASSFDWTPSIFESVCAESIVHLFRQSEVKNGVEVEALLAGRHRKDTIAPFESKQLPMYRYWQCVVIAAY